MAAMKTGLDAIKVLSQHLHLYPHTLLTEQQRVTSAPAPLRVRHEDTYM
jgi:hypothetical protein